MSPTPRRFAFALLALLAAGSAAPAQSVVGFAATALSASEPQGTVSLTVTLTPAATQTVTVQYATRDGSATSPTDYTAATGTLVFAPGETSKTISITLSNDTIAESSESFAVDLSNAQNATLDSPSTTATVTITDDDSAQTPPTVAFAAATFTVAENGTTATIGVTLSAASSTAVTVQYTTSDGTATASQDYSTTSGTLTFPANVTALTFAVPITDDTQPEPNETVNLTLSAPSGATLGMQSTATLTITDNDAGVTVTFSLNPIYVSEQGSVTVTPTVNPGAASPDVLYDTADPNVATIAVVADHLTVTGVAAGSTQLRAVYKSQVIATVDVQVVRISFSVDPVYVGDEGDVVTITATVTPTAAATQVKFESADTSIATVKADTNGGGYSLTMTGAAGGTTDLIGLLQGEENKKAKTNTVSVAMEIYRPKVIDPAESMVKKEDRLTKGSQTFVNLDNDDNKDQFDGDQIAKPVPGGDDELVKVRLKLKSKDLKEGKAKLTAVEGGGTILVWLDNEKKTDFFLETELMVPKDFQVQGDYLVKDLWVESPLVAHTIQRAVKLKMTYDKVAARNDQVALTVIGIEKIAWKGKGNSFKNDDTLDSDPNYPVGLSPAGFRVLPDARIKDGKVEAAPRDRVSVEVTLSVQPIEPVKIYFKSFDVDDPSAEKDRVDEESMEKDNRGANQDGQFIDDKGNVVGSVLEKLFTNKVEMFDFQVTMQPGDNFRILGNGDRDFLDQLENHDTQLHVSGKGSQEDKMRITSKFVTGNTLADKEIREAGKYASPVLTVWRFLHVERDHMGAPGAGEKFDGVGKGNDDVDPKEPLPDPSIALMVKNYKPAYIEVLDDLGGAGGLNTTKEIPFVHNITSDKYAAMASRQIPSEDRFWVVNIVGCYEGPTGEELGAESNDNDPDGEKGNPLLGITPGLGTDGPCLIFLEVIRDIQADFAAKNAADGEKNKKPAALDTIIERLVLHESAHRFNMYHQTPPGDEGPLRQGAAGNTNIFGTDEENRFTPLQLHVIRNVSRPR